MIAINAAIICNRVSRSFTAVAWFMAIVAISLFVVLWNWTFSYAELPIFHVSAFKTVIWFGTRAWSFALLVAIATGIRVDLINAGEWQEPLVESLIEIIISLLFDAVAVVQTCSFVHEVFTLKTLIGANSPTAWRWTFFRTNFASKFFKE